MIEPVGTLAAAAADLRRPFAAKLVLWRAVRPDNGTWGDSAEVAPYINRALVIDRLNVVCPGLWSATYEVQQGAAGPLMWCHLTIDGVTRSDVGEGSGKALVSDSLKRAAMHFGVGVSLAAAPRVEYNIGATERFKLKRVGGDVWITELGRTDAQRHYELWLKNTGDAAYGEALQHGAPDQRRPIPGDTRLDEADQAAANPAIRAGRVVPAIDPDLVLESELKRIEDLAAKAGVEPPALGWEATHEERRQVIARLEAQVAKAAA
jgi:hypothetical protein